VQQSAIAPDDLQGAGQTDRLLETVGDGAEPDRLGAVIDLVVGDLGRTWMKQTRIRGRTPTTPIGAVLQRTSEESTCRP
jgi:hypothetical protein